MRTLPAIRSSGRTLQVVASAIVILLALAALAAPSQAGETWLDATSIAALLACAGGLMALTIGPPRLASALAIVAVAGGMASLDGLQALGTGDGSDVGSASGLLTRVIALATILGGLAIGAAVGFRKPRWRAMSVVSVGAIIVALGIAGLLHHLFPGADMSGPALWLTVWRALLLIVLGTAVILLGRRARNRLTRWRFLPLALAVTAGAVLLAQLVRIQEIDRLDARIQTTMERVEDQFSARLSASVLGIDRMVRSWTWRGQPERNDWKTDAWLFVDHFPEVRAVAWVDADTRVRWLVPLAGSHALQNNMLGDHGAIFGATSLTAADRDIDQLLERADRALYEAKDTGRNRIVYSEG